VHDIVSQTTQIINDSTILVVQHNDFDALIQTFVGLAFSGDKILQILNCTSITNEVTDASHNTELPPRVL